MKCSLSQVIIGSILFIALYNGRVIMAARLDESTTRPRSTRRLLQGAKGPSPRVQSILTSDLKQTNVIYNKHPFDQRRKLDEDFDPSGTLVDYLSDSYQPLRMKYIMDPIEARSEYVSSGFNQVLPDILNVVSSTWASYLSVIPINETIPLARDDCFSFYSQYITDDWTINGMADADMAIYVGAETSTIEGGEEVILCSPEALAFAFTCAIDQFERPIIGAINFCIDNIQRRLEEGVETDGRTLRVGNDGRKLDLNEEKLVYQAVTLDGNTQGSDMTLVAIHEVCHALGFTFNLFRYFRNPETGEPLTPRPFVATDVQCVDGSIQNLIWPASNTVETRQSSDGRYYHEVVTPRVTQVARNHFDCQSMTGARLENQPEAFNCTGSHWDERLYLSELMGPIFSGYSDVLSPLTLALLEDSGWYKVTYQNAPLSPFGKKRGCDFVNEPCIVDNEIPEYGQGLFCNTINSFTDQGIEANAIQCDPTHKSFAVCDLFDINEFPFEIQQEIPDDRIQYFSDPNLVSIFTQADFCPLAIIDVQLDCTNEDNNADVQTYRGESRGLSSRCINGRVDSQSVPGCFEIQCDETLNKVLINGQVCEFDGQELDVTTLGFTGGQIECPALATICPDLFCPGECSGRGECDYDSVPARCNCFDETDTTAACSKDTPAPPPTPPPSPGSVPTSSAPVPEPTMTTPTNTLPPNIPLPPDWFFPTSDASPKCSTAALTVLLIATVVALGFS